MDGTTAVAFDAGRCVANDVCRVQAKNLSNALVDCVAGRGCLGKFDQRVLPKLCHRRYRDRLVGNGGRCNRSGAVVFYHQQWNQRLA